MKFFLTLFALLSLSVSVSASDEYQSKAIYGADDRLDVFQSPDPLMRELARSVATQVSVKDVIEKPEWEYRLKTSTLAKNGLCQTERFAHQPLVGDCTGFLIAPDKMVTAGHCITSTNQCAGMYWVFDFAYYNGITEDEFVFNETQIAQCRAVIERVKNAETGVDYAVMLLDRKMVGRTPFKVRKEGKVNDDAILTIIGHPNGIPAKIASGAEIRDNKDPNFFVTNTDSFVGNSGSPVVDSRTGIVEGVLVRGESDYVSVKERGCMVPLVFDNDKGRGEDVIRINIIKNL